MIGVNKAFLVGNVGTELEVRETGNGHTVGHFRMVINEWVGTKVSSTWHTIVAWDKLCASLQNPKSGFSKGSPVFVEGSYRTSSYEKDGVKRYTHEVRATRITVIRELQKGPPPDDAPAEFYPADNNDDPF